MRSQERQFVHEFGKKLWLAIRRRRDDLDIYTIVRNQCDHIDVCQHGGMNDHVQHNFTLDYIKKVVDQHLVMVCDASMDYSRKLALRVLPKLLIGAILVSYAESTFMETVPC